MCCKNLPYPTPASCPFLLPLLLILLVAWLPFATAHTGQSKEEIDALFSELQQKAQAFPLLAVPADGSPISFEYDLAATTVTLADGATFSGLRFVAPPNAEEKDFIWYFNAASQWANWYILPAEGPYRRAFRNWIDADRFYVALDSENDERTRILQTLAAGYFNSDETFILWFRHIQPGGNAKLTGRLAFAKPNENWDHDAIEKQLALEPLDAAQQIQRLGSRGGEILLDDAFFEPSYASERIDSLFFTKRQTRRLQGGFFITMETSIPPCETEPQLADIERIYGKADFIQSSAEKEQVHLHDSDEKVTDKDDVTTHYYDFFGFEVANNDPRQRVRRVTTTPHDFSKLRSEESSQTMGRIPMKNLTVFYKDNEEVGRLYYFLEGAKMPLVIQEPPKGVYRLGLDALEYFGNGVWEWQTFSPEGKLASTLSLKAHREDGELKNFHDNGAIKLTATYKEGLLDGPLVQYDVDGKVVQRLHFQKGRRLEATASAAGEQ